MFEIDSARTSLPLSPDRVLALVASLNTPNIVAANLPVEPTRAHICVYREGADRVGVSIYLHCVDSEKGTFYRHEEGLLSKSRYDEAMAEALAFAESLGFMMDDLGFRDLAPARQRELIEESPLFHEPKPPAPASVASAEAGREAGEARTSPPPPPAPPAPPAPALPAPAPPAPAAPGPVIAASVAPTAVTITVAAVQPAPAAPPPPAPAALPALEARPAATSRPSAPHQAAGAAARQTLDARGGLTTAAAERSSPAPARAPAGSAAVKALVRLLASL